VVALFLAAVVLVLAGVTATARADGELFVPIPLEDEWLSIDKASATINLAQIGKDTFFISGSFNLPPASLDPATSDVTLSVDQLSITIPAASWTTKGAGRLYKAKQDGVSVQIVYWVKGSSRCNYKFTGSRQDVKSNVPNFPDLPVRLIIGAGFDETITATMNGTSATSAKMYSLNPQPIFVVDKIGISRNLKKVDKDSFSITGRGYVDSGFDTSTNGVYMQVGPFSYTIAVGDLVQTGTKLSYKGTLPSGGTVTLTANMETGKITITGTKVDLSAMTNPLPVRFVLTFLPDGMWGYNLTLQSNKTGTAYKY
jgi:hypothetical protein